MKFKSAIYDEIADVGVAIKIRTCCSWLVS